MISVDFNTSKSGKLIYSGLGFVEQHYCITSHILLEILRQITLWDSGIINLLLEKLLYGIAALGFSCTTSANRISQTKSSMSEDPGAVILLLSGGYTTRFLGRVH